MSKCRLVVTIDGWEAMGDIAPTYDVGAPITGVVHVWVDERVRCDGLVVQVEPVATMRGYGVGPAQHAVRVFQGEWEAGEYDYRFSLPSPWPPTYAGKHVGWKWVVRATADVPWAMDPEGTSEFQLVLSETPTDLEITPILDSSSPPPRRGWIRVVKGLMALGAVMLAAGGVGSYYQLGSDELTGDVSGIGFVILLAGLIVLGKLPRGETTSRSLERVNISHRSTAESYRSSTPASIECDVKPRSGIDVASMSAHLIVMEYAEWTTTKNEHTQTHRYKHLFHLGDTELAFDAEAKSWRGSLGLPELSGVPCFSFGHPPGHGIVWKVELWTHLRGNNDAQPTLRFLHVRPKTA